MTLVAIGLGSNIGDRALHLATAVATLKKAGNILACSKVYESPALLTDNAPEAWNMDYLNAVLLLDSKLPPPALLDFLKEAERETGRINRGYWSPREIDLDILAYGELIVNTDNLQIPHQFLCERDFALLPLAETWPDWVHPVHKKSAAELANGLGFSNIRETALKLM